MPGTADLPIFAEGKSPPQFAEPAVAPRQGRITDDGRYLDVSPIQATGCYKFAMPGTMVWLQSDGKLSIGDRFQVGDVTVGVVMKPSDEEGHCVVKLDVPIESSAETPLVDRLTLAREKLYDLASPKPVYQWRASPQLTFY